MRERRVSMDISIAVSRNTRRFYEAYSCTVVMTGNSSSRGHEFGDGHSLALSTRDTTDVVSADFRVYGATKTEDGEENRLHRLDVLIARSETTFGGWCASVCSEVEGLV